MYVLLLILSFFLKVFLNILWVLINFYSTEPFFFFLSFRQPPRFCQFEIFWSSPLIGTLRIKWYGGSWSVAFFQLNQFVPLCPLEQRPSLTALFRVLWLNDSFFSLRKPLGLRCWRWTNLKGGGCMMLNKCYMCEEEEESLTISCFTARKQ